MSTNGPNPSHGSATAIAAAALALLGAVASLALLFPAYLTSPDLRAITGSPWATHALHVALGTAAALAAANLIRRRDLLLSAGTGALSLGGMVAVAWAERAPQGTAGTLYISLDWLVIDLVVTAGLFVCLERTLPHRAGQPTLRAGWRTDLGYFAVNHLLVGVILLLANMLGQQIIGPAVAPALKASIGAMPTVLAVPLILLIADLVQYWVHRAYHASPLLWRIHRVHHSSESMDWLAGSRQHALELIATRTLGLAPLIALGFDKTALDIAIGVAMVQAVLNHANVDWPRKGSRLAWLRAIVVTPQFHHWHHAREGARNRNFAALFSFLDHIFGTAVADSEAWPSAYGIGPAPAQASPAQTRPVALR